MTTLNTLSNHVSSLPAKTVQTSAHALRGVVAGFGKWDVAAVHSKSFFSNPLSFSARRSDPYRRFSTSMNDSQSPLCLEFNDIIVRNQLSIERVDNLDGLISEDEFGFDPNCIANSNQDQADQQFESDLKRIGIDDKTVCREEANQQNRNDSPNKVTSWAKGFIHRSIIAGETQ